MLVSRLLYHPSPQFTIADCMSSAIIPVTVLSSVQTRAHPDSPFHPGYKGLVFFRNTFVGKLPATDYPKVNVSSWPFNTRPSFETYLSSSILPCFWRTLYSLAFGAGCASSTSTNCFPFKYVGSFAGSRPLFDVGTVLSVQSSRFIGD